MRTEFVKTLAAIAGIVILATMQDLIPAAYGAKPPFLLMFSCFAGVPTAIVAGLFVDALSGISFGCSAVFYVVAALLVRYFKSSAFLIVVISAALYQVWIIMWGGVTSSASAYMSIVYAIVLYPVGFRIFHNLKLYVGIERNYEEGQP